VSACRVSVYISVQHSANVLLIKGRMVCQQLRKREPRGEGSRGRRWAERKKKWRVVGRGCGRWEKWKKWKRRWIRGLRGRKGGGAKWMTWGGGK
jgi:hypothetical protein